MRLREVQPSDVDYLYRLTSDPDVAWRWQYRRQSIAFETFAQQLEISTLVHFVVERISTGELTHSVAALDLSMRCIPAP